jgi:hypothetical protein
MLPPIAENMLCKIPRAWALPPAQPRLDAHYEHRRLSTHCLWTSPDSGQGRCGDKEDVKPSSANAWPLRFRAPVKPPIKTCIGLASAFHHCLRQRRDRTPDVSRDTRIAGKFYIDIRSQSRSCSNIAYSIRALGVGAFQRTER